MSWLVLYRELSFTLFTFLSLFFPLSSFWCWSLSLFLDGYFAEGPWRSPCDIRSYTQWISQVCVCVCVCVYVCMCVCVWKWNCVLRLLGRVDEGEENIILRKRECVREGFSECRSFQSDRALFGVSSEWKTHQSPLYLTILLWFSNYIFFFIVFSKNLFIFLATGIERRGIGSGHWPRSSLKLFFLLTLFIFLLPTPCFFFLKSLIRKSSYLPLPSLSSSFIFNSIFFLSFFPTDHKFEIAIQLNKLRVAYELAKRWGNNPSFLI